MDSRRDLSGDLYYTWCEALHPNCKEHEEKVKGHSLFLIESVDSSRCSNRFSKVAIIAQYGLLG